MKTILFDTRQQRLRNGWWILIFLAFVLVTRVVHAPLLDALKAAGVGKAWREPLPVLFLLLATWACMRLRRQTLADAGVALDRRRAGEFASGLLVGCIAILLVTGLLIATGSVSLALDPARSAIAVGYGLYAFLMAAALEELLFRGFVFQRLIDGIGVWGAQLGLAALFALAHWSNPEMEGAARLFATIDTALAAIMLGLAYLRTRSLALPLGIHLGWNWMQGSVLGFNVSGFDQAGWLQPTIERSSSWISGGGVGPEGSVFSVVVDLMLIAALWTWRGRAGVAKPAPGLIGPPEAAAAG